ncbi:cupin domain protein [Usnea florida]
MEPLNLQNLLTRFSDHWSQRTIGTINDYEIKLAKLLGEFVWHSHQDTDELFLILYGTLNIQLRDRDVILNPGEIFVVPRGVEHCPKAEQEVGVLLLEPKGVVNTGDSGREDLRIAPKAMESL